MKVFTVIVAVVGFALLGIGALVGNTTFAAPYQSVQPGYVQTYISGNQSNGFTSYLQMKGGSSIFIIHEHDFTPTFSYQSLGADQHLSLVYRPIDSTDVDVTATDGLELKGTGYTTSAISVINGSNHTLFATAAYASNSSTYQENQWAIGGWFMAIGGAAIVLMLILIWILLARAGIWILPF